MQCPPLCVACVCRTERRCWWSKCWAVSRAVTSRRPWAHWTELEWTCWWNISTEASRDPRTTAVPCCCSGMKRYDVSKRRKNRIAISKSLSYLVDKIVVEEDTLRSCVHSLLRHTDNYFNCLNDKRSRKLEISIDGKKVFQRTGCLLKHFNANTYIDLPQHDITNRWRVWYWP